MTGAELRELLADITADLERHVDEFRALDAAVGDGDLGVTVKAGSVAVRTQLAELDEACSVADVMRESAQAIANANPSTMSALVAAGLLKAAREVGPDPVGVDGAAAGGAAFVATVGARGKAERGDKTMLDAIGPAVTAVAERAHAGAGGKAVISAAVEAAQRGVEETTPLVGRKGRARWIGDRSKGHPDPGAVVVQRFLEAWQEYR